MNSPSKLKPALIAGLAFGFLGSIPPISCCCCLVAAGGGVLAAFLLSKESKSLGLQFGPGEGALVGVLTAVFYAIAGTFVATVISMVWPQDPTQMLTAMEDFGMEIPPEAWDSVEQFSGGGEGAGVLVTFFTNLVFNGLLGVVFCTLGGLLGGVLFKNEPQAPTETTPAV